MDTSIIIFILIVTGIIGFVICYSDGEMFVCTNELKQLDNTDDEPCNHNLCPCGRGGKKCLFNI